jgi:hypothetical protein
LNFISPDLRQAIRYLHDHSQQIEQAHQAMRSLEHSGVLDHLAHMEAIPPLPHVEQMLALVDRIAQEEQRQRDRLRSVTNRPRS